MRRPLLFVIGALVPLLLWQGLELIHHHRPQPQQLERGR